MAFGIEIKTTGGNYRSGQIRVARLLLEHTFASSSGSVVVSEFSQSNGFMWCPAALVVDPDTSLEWDEATKTLSWTDAQAGDRVFFFRRGG